MPNVSFFPYDYAGDASGEFLTFIVPAVDGCNLKCSYCFISQRKEISQTLLTPPDYAEFIEAIAAAEPVVGVAIQGHEPLLPGSMPYTTAILRTARDLGIPASLVTNGTSLTAAFPLLTLLRVARVGVSLDAATSDRHDRLRGVAGTWTAATKAILTSIKAAPAAGARLTVISVLMPRRRAYLDAMPRLLQDLGVRDWIINPLTTIGKEVWTGPDDLARLLDDLLMLDARAKSCGVAVAIDDAPGLLKSKLLALVPEQAANLNIRSLPAGVTLSRLMPNGQCSVGKEIVQRAPPHAETWRAGNISPAHFLRESRRREAVARRELQHV